MTLPRRWIDLLAIAFLAILTLVFFWKIALTNLILAGFDIFTYFYPYKAYAAEAIAQGRLPLWNPYLFGGAPFLANPQTAIFYPLNWLLDWLPAPSMVSVSIVLHVFLGAVFAYLFARASMQLGRFGSFVAAATFAFGGYVGAQAEHVNQLNVLAWLPLLLLLFDLARRGTRMAGMAWVLLASMVVAAQIFAGHTQASYVALFVLGWFAAFPLLGAVWEWLRRQRSTRDLLGTAALNIGLYVAIMGLGATLAAAQLWPTVELSSLSIRSEGLPYRLAASFSLRPKLVLESFLPSFDASLFSEYIAYIGFLPLALTLAAIAARGANRYRAFFVFLAVLGLFLAFGGYNPFYVLLYNLIPGFALFRVPARWLFVYALAMAMLAGIGADGLLSISRRHFLLLGVLVFAAAIALFQFVAQPPTPVLTYWVGGGLAAMVLVMLGTAWSSRAAYRALVAVLIIVELFAASRVLAYNQPTAPEAFTSLRPSTARLLIDPGLFRVLSLSPLNFDPGDLGDMRQIYADDLSPQATYDLVAATKEKEVIIPNLPLLYRIATLDGYDGGVLPLRRFVEFERLFLPPERLSPDGQLWQKLTAVPSSRLLALANVKYVIADKVQDVWVDGVYYDLRLTTRIKPKGSITLVDPWGFQATSLGIVSYLDGANDVPQGAAVAELVTTDRAGGSRRYLLRAGVVTAKGLYSPAVQHRSARAVHAWVDVPGGNDYLAKIDLGTPTYLRELRIESRLSKATFVLRGLSLIDDRTGTSRVLTVDPSFRLVHSGDVKIYENRAVLPRAYVVHRARVVSDDAAAITAMQRESFRPETEVVLAEGQELAVAPAGPDRVEVTSYAPERVVIAADLASEGYLVLADADYPGWQAQIDGRDTPILRANVLFRAVHLPAGSHRIEFAYQPESLRRGAMVSGVAAAVVALGLIVAVAIAVLTQR